MRQIKDFRRRCPPCKCKVALEGKCLLKSCILCASLASPLSSLPMGLTWVNPSHLIMRRDEEEHGMQNNGGRILFYSSWIGMPRGAPLPQGNQEAGSWESNWQMADQQTRVERMLNWHREPESENSGSRAGRYFFHLSDGQKLK